MKAVYPIIITPPENGEKFYLVYVPDFDAYTQGYTLEEALYMAKDLIALSGVDLEDDGKPIPKPSILKPVCKENELTALVDVDFSLYRKKLDERTVRKNVTIPAWLEREASEKHINFSAVLQKALVDIIEA